MTTLKERAEEYAVNNRTRADTIHKARDAYLAGAAAAKNMILADLCQMLAVTEDQRDFGNAMLARIRALLPDDAREPERRG